MSITKIREQLHQYIDQAEDKKIKAIYTMVEEEIQTNSIWDDDSFVAELERRVEELESGKAKGLTFDQVVDNARKAFKAKRP
jgi:putative addiction module component (TIGR02574 family)